jgi:hypothetical protein
MRSIRRASPDPPVAGLSQPLLFSVVVPPGSACMYNAAFRYLSDRRGRHNGKLTRTCDSQCLTVKTRLSISDSGAHKCDGHHKKPPECDDRHKKQVSSPLRSYHRSCGRELLFAPLICSSAPFSESGRSSASIQTFTAGCIARCSGPVALSHLSRAAEPSAQNEKPRLRLLDKAHHSTCFRPRKRFSAKFLEQGPKLISRIRKSPLGGDRQMGEGDAGQKLIRAAARPSRLCSLRCLGQARGEGLNH